jgi:hypothetical protein
MLKSKTMFVEATMSTFRLFTVLFLSLVFLLSFSGIASAQYLATYDADAGNPGGVNTESDAPGQGTWTTIVAGPQSANIWSPATAIPFAFDFFGTPVTYFKASQNGLVTFDTSATQLPNANRNLPTDSLPNMTIASLWDEFTSSPPTGTGDDIRINTFGTAPNRQFWIKWYSFEIGNPFLSFAYFACVLEETTNNIYIVDLYSSTTPAMTATVGIQFDNATAVQFGDSLLTVSGNGSSNTDNDYWSFFIPPTVDVGVTQFLNIPNSVLPNFNYNFDVEISNLGADPVGADTVDIFVNGGLSSSYEYSALASSEHDTITASVTSSASPGTDQITAALRTVSGDGNLSNDTLSTSVGVDSIFAAPYFESFDSTTIGTPGILPPGWTNATDDQHDWYVEATGVQNSTLTGPIADHSGTGNYMYVESSSPYFNVTANLLSPFFDLSGMTQPTVEFWFHMYGQTMGEMHFDVWSSTSGWVNDVRGALVGEYQTAETDPWIRTGIDLTPFIGDIVQVRFRGITGPNFYSDMAMDDARLDEYSNLTPFPDEIQAGPIGMPLLTKMPLTQPGITSAVNFEGSFTNAGFSNTGDINVEVTNSSTVYSNSTTGVTIPAFESSTFSFGPWDASSTPADNYNIRMFSSNFAGINDTANSVLELGQTMAWDFGVHTTSISHTGADAVRIGARFTLTDADTLTSVRMLLTSSTVATDSFAVDLYTSVNDTPGVAIARIYEGTFGDFGTLPALVIFPVTPKMAMPAGDFYAMIETGVPSAASYPIGADGTGLGASALPKRFVARSSTSAWLFFEDAGNATFHTLTPIIRTGYQEVLEIHDFAVDQMDVEQACMTLGETYTVTARIRNLGNQTEGFTTIELHQNGVFAGDDFVQTLDPGQNTTVSFPYTPTVTGVVKLDVVSLLANDGNAGNDTATTYVRVTAHDIVFVDDFEDTSFTNANWLVVDDPTSTNSWMIYPPPYPNLYTLPVTSSGNVAAADADDAGSGSITISTALLPLDLTGYDSVFLDFDSDWQALDAQDTARVKVSNDGGATWTTLIEWPGPGDVRNTHEALDLTPYVAGSANAVIAAEAIEPGYDWWWTIDNVCVSGVAGVPAAYTQSFEGTFPPSHWSKLNPDGGTGWNQQTNGTTPIPGWNGGTITVPAGGGNAVAFCTWNTGGGVSNDQYLVSPQLRNIQSGDYVAFWLRYWPDTYNDTLDVVLSTTDPSDPANFNILVDQLGFGAGSDTNWVMYSYDLSGFVSAGSNVYVGLREHVQDNLNNGSSFSLDLFSTSAVADTGQVGAPGAKLLITEIVVTPTAGEFVEIYNPNSDPVDLSNFYLTDATFAGDGTYYYKVVEGGGGGGGFGDFDARFPDGATIAAGEYQTVALNGDSAFYATYGVMPTYELYDDGHSNPSDAPDMREAVPGSINNQGGLTNSDEVVILFYWDGLTDLVQDIDYLLYNTGSPIPNDEAVDKTGVRIDGPDTGTDSSMYLPDTPTANQMSAPSHNAGFSVQRTDLTEGAQTMTGGNGINGADETSEDLNNTFVDTLAPTPNAPAVPPVFSFSDDFESYTAGMQLAAQTSNWTTWSGSPGSGEDPFVSNAQAYSGSNSVVIVQNNDLVKTFGSQTSGRWSISFQVYIPSGKAGYFNTLAGFTPNPNNWGMEVYFNAGGAGSLNGGGAGAATFSWAADTWQPVEVIVDLDNDLAEFWFDGAMVHSWTWTAGGSGGGSPLQLDANDFFGATANDEMYFDDYDIHQAPVGIEGEQELQIPEEFALYQNYPNPFNPTTTIKYDLKQTVNVELKIYNVLGQLVRTLVNETQEAGHKTALWDGLNDAGNRVATGIYIYRIHAADFVKSRKMIMMK